MISPEATLTVLRRGVDLVQEAVDSFSSVGQAWDRVRRLVETSHHITWAYVEDGTVVAVENTRVTEVQVAVLARGPDDLDLRSTFQTLEGDDGVPRVYVRRRPFTAAWAGIVLFHELDHVLDHLEGTWPAQPTVDDWWEAEARAYHREALVIDAVCEGRFLMAIRDLAATHALTDLFDRDPHELASDLLRQSVSPSISESARSEAERWTRSAAVAMAAVVAVAAHPVGLADLPSSASGSEVRRAAAAWGWSGYEG